MSDAAICRKEPDDWRNAPAPMNEAVLLKLVGRRLDLGAAVTLDEARELTLELLLASKSGDAQEPERERLVRVSDGRQDRLRGLCG